MDERIREKVFHAIGEMYVPKEVVYYLGAGASFNGLPLVKNFEEQMEKQVEWLLSEDVQKKLKGITTEEINHYQNNVAEISQNSKNHASIDTYAKKLYITNRKKYEILKITLSVFLTIEQLRNGPDFRYDSFFASIIGNTADDLPANFGIISWNYDCHIELAYMKYAEEYRLQKVQNLLHINSKNHFIHRALGFFNVLKLNGSATIINEGENILGLSQAIIHDWPKSFSSDNIKQIKEVFDSYVNLFSAIDNNLKDLEQKENSINCNLSFCWEKEFKMANNAVIETGIEMIQTAKNIVVIGYSFPFFNRDIDEAFFKSMRADAVVYIQDPRAEGIVNSLKERFPELENNIKPITLNIDDNTALPLSRRIDGFFIPTDIKMGGSPEFYKITVPKFSESQH
ncbi:hypothetical protein G3O08_14620 [Cryomorpha ignava]|uniref:SIR2-like domain-containing protein n=1 Tax=Cryomorpha ignava TaxID=101383 RepID=A0A7K3WTE1_9FLAO|nr:hypothetical protein [Cryomorpha ignava]NEN24736.1 hypothetical protein [Cryomorpha ignava]